MKWVWFTLAVVVVLVVLVLVVGALLPVEHTAARRLQLRQPAAVVFAALADVQSFVQWRHDLKSVELLPAQDGKPCYREVSGFGPIDLRVETEVPDSLRITRIVTPDSPFGGTWTFSVTPNGSGVEVAITEHGEVYNVLFRALSRFVFGHATHIDAFLGALATRFGEPIVLQDAVPAAPPTRPAKQG